MSKPVICLMGPTASGKTDLAVRLVQQLPCDIISVDSALIYRGMDIGTAKPGPEILQIAPHRLIDICDPAMSYSAGQFRSDALQEIENTIANNRIPLLVGGTMLYFHALQNGIAELPEANLQIRDDLAQIMQQHGLQTLYARLQKIDPESAQRIHPNDPQRIQRALEIYAITGKTLTQFWQEQNHQTLPYHFINIAIAPQDRNLLHKNIVLRFQAMLAKGFIAEVENLFKRDDLHADLPAMRAVGYRQVWDYLANKLTYDEMTDRSIIATRQLAKRQITWLRSWKDLTLFASEDINTLHKILKMLSALNIA